MVVRTVRVMLGALLISLVVSPLAAQQDEKSWSLEVAYDYSSIYLFRGIDVLADEPVHVPRVVFGWGGLSASVWGYAGTFSDELAAGLSTDDYRELDYTLDYTFSFANDKLSLTVGGILYTYPDPPEYGDFETTELYAILSADVALAPTLTIYRDIDLLDSTFVTLALGHSFPLGEKASLDLSAALSYDFDYNAQLYFVDKSSGTNDLLVGVNVPWQVTDSFSLRAQVQRSVALDILDDIGQEDETIWTVGGALGF
ncbi:MAG TPA: hypothetical protein VF017_14790 [Thermoanaerobaculia bacterium]|nr:hypothetical protein [Thermoanaerobaculia bacterium]